MTKLPPDVHPPASEPDKAPDHEWGQPIPLEAVGVLPLFPIDALPPPFARFVEGEARATQTPPDLAGMLVLTAIATLAARRVTVEARPGWVEPLNVFTVGVMPPGERKSAVFAAVIAPIEEIEQQLAAEAAPRIREQQMQRRMNEAALKKVEKEAEKAKLEGRDTRPKIIEALELSALLDEPEPVPPRLIADDATPEAVASLLANHDGRIAILSAEGGVFDILAGRYTANGGPNFDVFLHAHSGDTHRVDRIGRPDEYVQHPAITVGLTVQPEVLRQIGTRQGFRGRGLLGRFLYALPVSRLGHRAICPEPVPDDVTTSYEGALHRVHGACRDGRRLTMSVSAHQLLVAFETDLEPRLGDWGDLQVVRDWAGKLVGAVARIAGLLHLAGTTTMLGTSGSAGDEITETTMRAAIRVGEYLIPHALRAFDVMGDPSSELTVARKIAAWIERLTMTEFSVRDAFDQNRGALIPTVDTLLPGLTLLEEHEWIRPLEDAPRSERRGRPASPRYAVNPNVGRAHRDNDGLEGHTEPAQPAEPGVLRVVRADSGVSENGGDDRPHQADDDHTEHTQPAETRALEEKRDSETPEIARTTRTNPRVDVRVAPSAHRETGKPSVVASVPNTAGQTSVAVPAEVAAGNFLVDLPPTIHERIEKFDPRENARDSVRTLANALPRDAQRTLRGLLTAGGYPALNQRDGWTLHRLLEVDALILDITSEELAAGNGHVLL